MHKRLISLLLVASLSAVAYAQERRGDTKLVGMYVHQGWSYNHPYAARTWTLADWRSYLDGLSKLGYNSVLIWPMLETMPNPLTASDRIHVDKTKSVIDLAHQEFQMKVYIVFCPISDRKANWPVDIPLKIGRYTELTNTSILQTPLRLVS